MPGGDRLPALVVRLALVAQQIGDAPDHQRVELLVDVRAREEAEALHVHRDRVPGDGREPQAHVGAFVPHHPAARRDRLDQGARARRGGVGQDPPLPLVGRGDVTGQLHQPVAGLMGPVPGKEPGLGVLAGLVVVHRLGRHHIAERDVLDAARHPDEQHGPRCEERRRPLDQRRRARVSRARHMDRHPPPAGPGPGPEDARLEQ
nr:hypothetical protein [Streptomyces himastatinicus]